MPHPIQNLCVFCGANKGKSPLYADAALALGQICAQNNVTIWYGGADIGLMGLIANGCLAEGGEVKGVLPHFIADHEIAHPALTELHFVEDLMTRKKQLMDASDAFLALPGGLGTFDELFEVLTWGQLSRHHKPIAVLNINNFYAPLMSTIKKSADEGFIDPKIIENIIVADTVDCLLEQLQQSEGLHSQLEEKVRQAKCT